MLRYKFAANEPMELFNTIYYSKTNLTSVTFHLVVRFSYLVWMFLLYSLKIQRSNGSRLIALCSTLFILVNQGLPKSFRALLWFHMNLEGRTALFKIKWQFLDIQSMQSWKARHANRFFCKVPIYLVPFDNLFFFSW